MEQMNEKQIILANKFAAQKYELTRQHDKYFFDVEIDCLSIILPAHKYVLSSRSEILAEQLSSGVNVLEWTDYEDVIGIALLRWIYTDKVLLNNDALSLGLLQASHHFRLASLFETCENALLSSVNEKTSLQFLEIAKTIGANRLIEKCLELRSNLSDDQTENLQAKFDEDKGVKRDFPGFHFLSDSEWDDAPLSLFVDVLKHNKRQNGLQQFLTFSDTGIRSFVNDVFPAHKHFLSSRSKKFRDDFLKMQEDDNRIWLKELYGGDLECIFLRWLYTDFVDLGIYDHDDDGYDHNLDYDDDEADIVDNVLALLKASKCYELPSLFERCEQAVLKKLTIISCAKLHDIATEVCSKTILEHCQQLIASYWNRFQSQDFFKMDLDSDEDSNHSMTVCEQSSIDSRCVLTLNDDCLIHVFRFVSLIDLGSIKATCKRLSQLADQSFKLRKDKSLTIDDSSLFADMWILKHFGKFLKSLHYRGTCSRYASHDDILKMIAKYSNEQLKSISFNFDPENCESFDCLEKTLKNVESITLKCFIIDRHVELLLGYCENLKEVHLEGQDMSFNTDWCSKNVNITSLSLFGLKSGDTLEEICEKLPHLENLSCENMESSSKKIIHLSRLNRLRRLKIEVFGVNIGQALQNCTNKNALEYLCLLYADMTETLAYALGDFPNLKELEFDNCCSFGVRELNILSKTLSVIEKLSFKECNEITFDNITKIVENYLNLKELWVLDCPKAGSIDKGNYLRLRKKRKLKIYLEEEEFELSIELIGLNELSNDVILIPELSD